jgi:glucokinase
MLILAGDIGGTSARLALYDCAGETPRLRARHTYPSRAHAGADEIVAAFVRTQGVTPAALCVGIAGPVRDGTCRTTNLPWTVTAAGLAAATGVARALLINDLEAAAWGIDAVPAGLLTVLQSGEPDPAGNQSVVAAGTGFGEAGRAFVDGRPVPFASEGGHADFAPRTEQDCRFLHWLEARVGHASWDRIVSGPGLAAIHDFLREERGEPAPAWLRAALAEGDPAAVISEAALAGTDAVCDAALDLFVRHFGAEAGNHALKLMATGGVYLAGGIAPKILPRLSAGAFLTAFADKGRMAPLLQRMPVTVIRDGDVALAGAALCARRALAG